MVPNGPILSLFGAAPDTGNMGVNALYASTIAGLKRHLPTAEFVVFDGGKGRRRRRFSSPGIPSFEIDCAGAHAGRRYYRPGNIAAMDYLARWGAVGSLINANLRLIEASTAVLDISGGDSFSDIYGPKRFFSVTKPKLVALRKAVPLVLLPQTYGPFRDKKLARIARDAIAGTRMAWARDIRSFEALKDLLGTRFNPDRHRCGVDVAFGLAPSKPLTGLDPQLQAALTDTPKQRPVIGLNVSGLLFNDAEAASRQFGFKANYPELIRHFIAWLLEATDAIVVLVPHVMVAPGHIESDLAASDTLSAEFGERFAGRIHVSPTNISESEVKWLISKTDWFCGSRMHSTIAALSSGIPAASIAYSDKTRGVFESCNLGSEVFDPRLLETREILEKLQAAFLARDRTRAVLASHLPAVQARATEQMAEIARVIQSLAG